MPLLQFMRGAQMLKEEVITPTDSLQEKKAKSRIKWLLITYSLIGLFLAILTPSTIFEYPWAQVFTNFMANQLPFVARVGRLAEAPAVQFIAAAMNPVAII